MNFAFTEEQLELQEMVREFVGEKIKNKRRKLDGENKE